MQYKEFYVVDSALRQQTWIPAFAGMTEMDETIMQLNYFSGLARG